MLFVQCSQFHQSQQSAQHNLQHITTHKNIVAKGELTESTFVPKKQNLYIYWKMSSNTKHTHTLIQKKYYLFIVFKYKINILINAHIKDLIVTRLTNTMCLILCFNTFKKIIILHHTQNTKQHKCHTNNLTLKCLHSAVKCNHPKRSLKII